MDALFMVLYVLFIIETLLIAGFVLLIMKSVGFGNLFKYYKAKVRRKKGWGLARFLHRTGYPELVPVKLEGEQISVGDEDEKYILKGYCIYRNEFDIPTIDYRKGDAEPIDPRTGLQTITSPRVLGNIQKRAVVAEKMVDPGLDWIKKNWKMLGIGVLIAIGITGYIIISQAETITKLSLKLAEAGTQQVIINASMLKNG